MARMEKIWISKTAFGGCSYSAYTDKATVSVRRGELRTSGHREILRLSINEWNELLDQNGEPSFGRIENLAHEWRH